MTPRVREILSWYGSENVGALTNMARVMNHGRLAGTGKVVILPVDQGFEHGPTRSFGMNPDAFDPAYFYRLAIESGCNAYAAPLGFIEASAREFAGDIPLILKVNNSETLYKVEAPISAMTSSINSALKLGCVGIGFTIYPGSAVRRDFYEQLAKLTEEAKNAGLLVVVWSYARGANLSKAGETGIDVISYAAHIAAQMGAHFIKVKPPTAHIEQAEAKKVFEGQNIPIAKLSDRIRHVVQSSFNGKRVVIFSGGEPKTTAELMEEIREIARGGGFGSIMGRNAFQRPKAESIKLLQDVMDVFKG